MSTGHRVFVKRPGETCIELKVDLDTTTVLELKCMMCYIERLFPTYRRLEMDERMLRNDATLRSCGIKDRDIVFILENI